VIRQKITQEGKTINLSPLIEQILLRQRINNPDIFRSIDPKESQGFVSVQQLQQANANVQAVFADQPPPFPPQEGDDHRAKLESYGAIRTLLQQVGQTNELLEQLIQLQAAFMQAEQEKEATPGQRVDRRNLKQPSVQSVGSV
jgi:hypothetical protein